MKSLPSSSNDGIAAEQVVPTEDSSSRHLPLQVKTAKRHAAGSHETDDVLSWASEDDDKTLAGKETKAVHVLRVVVLMLLLVIAALASTGVYFYTKEDEKEKFEADFHMNALRIIESFHSSVERRLGAVNSMATAITSHARDTNQNFPFVKVPDFEQRGADIRVQAGSVVIHWMPLVEDEDREKWEEYSAGHRFDVNERFEIEAELRRKQDAQYGLLVNETGSRLLQQSQGATTLDDGTGFHPKIWSNGAITKMGDEPQESGPYLPLWQSRYVCLLLYAC